MRRLRNGEIVVVAPDSSITINAGLSILQYEIDVTYVDIFDVRHKYRFEGRYERAMQRFLPTESRENGESE
jgi:hypothetical protein